MSLYNVHPSDGSGTLIGSTGLVETSGVAGMTFAPDGTLYAVINDDLYTLDPNSAAPTFIGSTGFDRISGLTAIRPVPESATLLLFGLGFAGFLVERHWSWRQTALRSRCREWEVSPAQKEARRNLCDPAGRPCGDRHLCP